MISRVIEAYEWIATHFEFLFDWLFSPIQFEILNETYYLGAPIYLLIGGSGVILVALFAWKLFIG